MSDIVINDLEHNVELDRASLTELRGGSGSTIVKLKLRNGIVKKRSFSYFNVNRPFFGRTTAYLQNVKYVSPCSPFYKGIAVAGAKCP